MAYQLEVHLKHNAIQGHREGRPVADPMLLEIQRGSVKGLTQMQL